MLFFLFCIKNIFLLHTENISSLSRRKTLLKNSFIFFRNRLTENKRYENKTR